VLNFRTRAARVEHRRVILQ